MRGVTSPSRTRQHSFGIQRFKFQQPLLDPAASLAQFSGSFNITSPSPVTLRRSCFSAGYPPTKTARRSPACSMHTACRAPTFPFLGVHFTFPLLYSSPISDDAIHSITLPLTGRPPFALRRVSYLNLFPTPCLSLSSPSHGRSHLS